MCLTSKPLQEPQPKPAFEGQGPEGVSKVHQLALDEQTIQQQLLLFSFKNEEMVMTPLMC